MFNKTLLSMASVVLFLTSVSSAQLDLKALPKTVSGFKISFFAQEPHIINATSLCFDKHGRLYVGAGPQYRHPKADSPTDYIKIFVDKDGDGTAETVTTFAEGLNSVQAMVWKGDELWVANSPDLTVLRDTDGDDVADEYKMIYTGLNTLRHGLHGLNWGPDGWLYMSIGNTWVENHAPLPFRQLQGNKSKDKTKYPLTKVYTAKTYKKSYHNMKKNEKEGGVFRCRPGGYDLELWARGMRNPWDITMDSGFNWLGTDNDPGRPGDRIFMPIQYGHYTMRHSWVFDWMGNHLAVAPASDLFEGVSGSGTGVVYYTSEHFPKAYRNSYLVADWTNHCVFHYTPKWDGALQVPGVKKVKIVDGGKTQAGDLNYKPGKGKSLFRPTDIEVGPDGALYIGGWGSVYGTKYVPASKWTKEENAKYQGRVFQLRHKNSLIAKSKWHPAKRDKKIETWTFAELMEDMGHQMPVWRVHSQDEIVRRGAKVRGQLLAEIKKGKLSEWAATWTIWALGRIDAKDPQHADIRAIAKRKGNLNVRIQAVRILGENRVEAAIHDLVLLLQDTEPRLRAAVMTSLRRTGYGEYQNLVLDSLGKEKDRVTFYTGWQVLRRLVSAEKRRVLMGDKRAGVRLAAMLSLMEERAATAPGVMALQGDKDKVVSKIASEWLRKTGAKSFDLNVHVSQLNFRAKTTVTMSVKGAEIRYTTDGSSPKKDSSKYGKPLQISEDATIRAAAFHKGNLASGVQTFAVHKITESEWKDRLFVRNIEAKGKHAYKAVDDGLQRGVRVYVGDSKQTVTVIPDGLDGATLIRTSAADASGDQADFLKFTTNVPSTLYVAYDARAKAPKWLSASGFKKTSGALSTSSNGKFSLYQKSIPAGTATLGGNKSDSKANMYFAFVVKTVSGKTTQAAVKAALSQAVATRGQTLFFGRGACFACHQVGGKGIGIGPDLVGIAKRRDAKYVITSILDPSQYIVEGFQQTSIQTKDGRTLFGMVQKETAQSIEIFLLTGQRVVVKADQVAKRTDAKLSGMPASFAHTLNAKDVADLTKYIIELKK
jgi:putative membrane-bound dehydrogenase-like protein